MLSHKINVLIKVSDSEERSSLANYLSAHHGYAIFIEDHPGDIQLWNANDTQFIPLGSDTVAYDVALLDTAFWNGEDTYLGTLKKDDPDVGLIFMIEDEENQAVEARKKGANRYIGRMASKNHNLIGQTIQLLSVERAIQQIAQDMTSFSPNILTRICEHVVKIFDIDHSGLVIFMPDNSKGYAIAEYPQRPEEVGETRPLGSEIPVRNVPVEQDLIYKHEVLRIENVEKHEGLGPVRHILWDIFGIRATLIVPIITRNNTVIASFSLDIYKDNRKFDHFSDDIVEMCERLAKQFAVAVEYYRLQKALEKTAQIVASPINDRSVGRNPVQAAKLDDNPFSHITIADESPLKDRLHAIVRIAVDLLRAKGGGLYRYDEKKEVLTIVADYDRPGNIGKILRKGQGVAGHLVATEFLTYLIEHNYKQSCYYVHEGFNAVVEVQLVWQNKTVGVLYVDDDLGRRFTNEEAQQLLLFANQAASTIAIMTQNRQIQAINRVMKNISDHHQVDELLSIIVTEVAHSLNSAHCTFFVKEDEGGEPYLIPKTSCGVGHHHIMLRRFRMNAEKKGLAVKVFETGEPILTGNAIEEYPEEFIEARLPKNNFRSMLLVPVKVHNDIIGVISTDQDALHAFNQDDQELVEALVQQVESVIERVTTLELLQETSRRIVSQENLTETLRHIVSKATKITHTSYAALYLLKMEAGKYVISKDLYDPPDFHPPEPRLGNEDGVTSRVLSSRSTITVYDIVKGDVRVHSEISDKYGIQSMIAVPLRREHQVIGVLFLSDKRRRVFTKTEIFSLETLTSMATIAIRNSQLFEERGRERDRLKALYSASETLTRIQGGEQILHKAARLVNEAARALAVRIVLFDEDGNTLKPRPVIIHPPDKNAGEKELVRENGYSVEVMKSGQYLSFPDVSKDPNINPHMLEAGAKAALCLPLSHQGGTRRIGVMWIQYEDPKEFTEQEIQELQLYAHQAAFAYDNAQRMSALEQGVRQVTESIASDIKSDYEQTRKQADESFEYGKKIAYVGFGIIVLGILIEMVFPGRAGIAAIVLGVITEAVSLLVFTRIDKANERMDNYHSELYEIRQFEQLFAAADKLRDREAEKQGIIQSARDKWL